MDLKTQEINGKSIIRKKGNSPTSAFSRLGTWKRMEGPLGKPVLALGRFPRFASLDVIMCECCPRFAW